MEREIIFRNLIKDLSGVAVEIGTCWGGWAEFLAINGSFNHLICVDPYKVYPKEIYNDALNTMSQQQCDDKFEQVCTRLRNRSSSLKTKITMLRQESEKASLGFNDGTVALGSNSC